MPTQPRTKTDLVEVQSKQIADLSERLGILNEVVVKRQEEADALKHDFVQTQAQIASAKRQWEQAQRQEHEQFATWKQAQQEAIALQQNDLNKANRNVQESLQRTQAFEEEVRLRLLELNAKGEEFRTIAQDRIDTGKLRQQAEIELKAVAVMRGQLIHAQNQSNAQMEDAKQIQADCERRNLDMQEAWNKCRAWEEELRVKARDVEIRETELKRQDAVVKATQGEPALV